MRKLMGYRWFKSNASFIEWQKDNPTYVINTILPDPDDSGWIFVSYYFTEPRTSASEAPDAEEQSLPLP